MPFRRLLPLVLAGTATLLLAAVAAADTTTAMGDRGGEGSTPFTGLANSPEANLFTGTAATAVRLMVPPGRKNLTPALTLQYSSAAGASPYGYGWDLPLGGIERSTKQGIPRCTGPTSNAFILSLPSGVMELVNDPPNSNTYRPRIEEAYLQATKDIVTNSWEVRDRSGMLYRFGTVAAARSPSDAPFMQLQSGVCTYTAAWALTRIEDPNGNAIDLTYNSVEHVSYPNTISYGGRTSADHLNRVRFHYETRPSEDQPVRYHAGTRSVLTLRLTQIFVGVLQPTVNEFRTYTLGYDAIPHDGQQSWLNTLGVTGYPTQLFTYQTSAPGFGSGTTYAPPPNIQRLRRRNGSGEVAQTILDMNGDGFVDLVHRINGSSPWRVYAGEPNGFAATYYNWSIPAVLGGANQIRNVWVGTDPCDENGWACTARDTFDLTGDGIPDYIVADDRTVYPPASPECPGVLLPHYRWKVYPGVSFDDAGAGGGFRATCAANGTTACTTDAQCSGAGNFCGTAWCAPTLDPTFFPPEPFIRTQRNDETFRDVVDMNADGRPDLVVSETNNWHVYLNTGSGFEPTAQLFAAPVTSLNETFSDDDFTLHMLVDFNGDALPDLVRQPKPSGTPLPYDALCGGSPSHLVRCLYVHLNTGQGFAAPYHVPVPGSSSGTVELGVQRFAGPDSDRRTVRDLFDVNGDGLPDWVRMDLATEQWQVILNTGGTFEPLSGASEPHPSWGLVTGPLRVQDELSGLTSVDLFDFDGDGFLNRVAWVSDTQWHVHENLNDFRPNLLVAMENGLTGRTTLRYAPSSTCVAFPFGGFIPCDHTGGDGRPDLPFVTWVVTAIRETDGLCTPPAAVDVFSPATNPCIGGGHERVAYFSYRDGRYDAGEREFRGFRDVYRTSIDGNTSRTVFGQDTPSKGRVLESVHYAGLLIDGIPAPPEVRHDYHTWVTAPIGTGRTQLWLGTSAQVTTDAQAAVAPLIFITQHGSPDAYGNVVSTLTGGLFDPHPVQTTIEYATPQGASQVYDKPRRTYSTRDGQVFSEAWFYYDGYGADADYGKVGIGNVTRTVSRLGSTPANFPETRMTYDAYGNIRTVTDALGRETETVYDTYHLYPASQLNALDHATQTVTDYRWGKPLSVTDANGAVTTYTYDSAGRLICVQRPLAAAPCSTAYTYTFADTAGELSRVDVDVDEPNHPSGYRRTTEHFDALGRHRATHTFRVVNGAPETVVTDRVEYDGAGRLASRAEAYVFPGSPSAFTTYDYHLNGGSSVDPLGRVYQTTAANGTTRRLHYKGSRHTTIDEEGVERRREVDPYGRVVREEIWRPGESVAYATTDTTYDGAGRAVATTQNGNPATTITNTYDNLGRRTQTIDPDSGTWRYVYDKAGNLIAQDDPKPNQHRQLCYDALDRVTLDCPLDSDYGGFSLQASCHLPCDPAREVRYTYDAASVLNSTGRLTQVTDGSGTTAFERYDLRGRVLQVTKEIAVDGVTSGTTEYQYDAADRVVRTRYPDWEQVETGYDASGQAITLQGSVSYVDDVSYDLFGRPTMIAHGNGVTDTRSYHESPGGVAHRQLSTLQTRRGGTDYLSLSYLSYTPRGAVQLRLDNRDSGGTLSNSGLYIYDPLGRLASVALNPEVNGVYEYDALGNLTRKESRYFDYSGTRPHQPSGVRLGSPGATPTPVAHDGNGNRENISGGGVDYVYDAWDRLTEITVSGGAAVTFVYDYGGRRVAKKVGGTVVTRYYSELTETTAGGDHYKSYCLGGMRVAAQRSHYVGWELASLAPPPIAVAATALGRPALVLNVRRDAQLGLGLSLTLLGTGLWLVPWQRRRRGSCAVRHGQVLVVLLALTLGSFPWPIAIRPVQAQCPNPTPTPTPPPTGEVRHYHTDHLGSTQAVTDAAGNLLEQIRYRAYGEVRGRWDGSDNPIVNPSGDYRYEFTGYETELSSGLQYAGARFYDPGLGMFLTHDPARQFASPYAYGPWDPMNGTDPSGADWGGLLIAGVVLAVLAVVAVGVDTAIRSGDALAGFKASGLALAAGSVPVGTSYGLNLVAPDLFGRSTPRDYAIALTPVVGTAYGAAQSFNNGNYASGAVAVVALAFTLYSLYESYQSAQGVKGGGQSKATIPGSGAPGSQSDAFHRTSDPLCVGSTVCGSDVGIDVSNDPLIREAGARFSGTYGDLGNVQVRAVPPSNLGSFDAQQLGSSIVEIRNDLFSGFQIDYSLTVLGHEYAHVLQTQAAGGVLAFHRLYDAYPNHYRNPFEFGANIVGRQFATSITGRYTPNYFPRHGIGP